MQNNCQYATKEQPCYNLHDVDGFYIERSMDLFQNFVCYVPSIEIRINPIVQFFPRHTKIPETSSIYEFTAVAEDLITILQNPHPPTLFLQR